VSADGPATATPSAIVCRRGTRTGSRAAREATSPGIAAVCTPTMRVPRRRSLTASATPASRPPPPAGTSTVPGGLALLEQLEPERALAHDDRKVVERRNEEEAALGGDRPGALLRALRRDHVERPAHLERAGALQVLALQRDLHAGETPEREARPERRRAHEPGDPPARGLHLAEGHPRARLAHDVHDEARGRCAGARIDERCRAAALGATIAPRWPGE